MRELGNNELAMIHGGFFGGEFLDYRAMQTLRDVVFLQATQLTCIVSASAITYSQTGSLCLSFASAVVGFTAGYQLSTHYILPYLRDLDSRD